MKKLVLFIATLFCSGYIVAQQRAQFTQYMVNQYVLNPAVGGTEDFTELRAGFRKQWLGLPGGPATVYFTAHTPIGKPKENKTGNARNQKNGWHGVGLMAYGDKTGPTARNSVYASYAYNMGLSPKLRLAIGTFAGAQQFRVNGDDFTLYHESDKVLNGVSSTIVPDVSLGSWLYSKRFYLGISAHQLLQNNLNLNDMPLPGISEGKLIAHYFVTGGYSIKFKEIMLIPSVMVKYANAAPLSMDFSAKANYHDGIFWLGAAYRSFDSFSIMAGTYLLEGQLPISYSYDLTTSKLFPHNTGSHEIIVGYRFPFKPQIQCPANFWD